MSSWEKIHERLDEVAKKPREEYPSWNKQAEVGDILRGEIVNVQEFETQYGTWRRALIRDKDGKVWRFTISEHLWSRWLNAGLVDGDHVRIEFTGVGKKGAKFYNVAGYKIESDEVVNFDSIEDFEII